MINENNMDIYKNNYMQNPFDILTKENLDRLEKHCKNSISYGNRSIKEEHEVTLALLYKYKDSTQKEKIREKINELIKNGYWDFLEERDLETTIDILKQLLEGD